MGFRAMIDQLSPAEQMLYESADKHVHKLYRDLQRNRDLQENEDAEPNNDSL